VSYHKLDARRLLCPMPVIRAQNKILELSAGDILEVTCTDPGALLDIPAWCRINGHDIIDTRVEENEDVLITIRVGA
jgi:tRNA 2-thiouridine synthesizing protein A